MDDRHFSFLGVFYNADGPIDMNDFVSKGLNKGFVTLDPYQEFTDYARALQNAGLVEELPRLKQSITDDGKRAYEQEARRRNTEKELEVFKLEKERLEYDLAKITLTTNQSVIDTNESVRDTNDSFKKLNGSLKLTNIASAIIALLTGIFIALTFFKQESTDLAPITIQLKQQAQMLDSMTKVQNRMASYLQGIKDSTSKQH